MSKFNYDIFYGGYDALAVSKEKYNKNQAIAIAKEELRYMAQMARGDIVYLAIGEAYARHRAGRNEDGEACVGWWLEYEDHKGNCPCWVFHVTSDKEEKFREGYEYIKMEINTYENE